MASSTYKLEEGRTARIQYGDVNVRVRPGENVEIDFDDEDQSAAIEANGLLEEYFVVEAEQLPGHRPFA